MRKPACQNSIRLVADASRSSEPAKIVMKRSRISGSPINMNAHTAPRASPIAAFLRSFPRAVVIKTTPEKMTLRNAPRLLQSRIVFVTRTATLPPIILTGQVPANTSPPQSGNIVTRTDAM